MAPTKNEIQTTRNVGEAVCDSMTSFVSPLAPPAQISPGATIAIPCAIVITLRPQQQISKLLANLKQLLTID